MWVAALPSAASRKETIKVLAQREKVSKDHKRKKDSSDNFLELCPSRRHVRLEDNVLTLMAEDGIEEHIEMRGCSVLSVSGGKDVSRKWAKKYPIQLESGDQPLFMGSPVCLLYLETSWEKETWCQVLRAASRWTINKEDLYIACKREFHEYCLRLDEAYPDFSKFTPSKSKNLEDESGKTLSKPELVGGLSRKQRLWKKIIKKGSWKGNTPIYKDISGPGDSKMNSMESKSACSGRGEDLIFQPSFQPHLPMEGSSAHGTGGGSSIQSNSEKVHTEDNHSLSDSLKSLDQVVLHESVTPVLDQGAMCWNILCSRLFFDGYHSPRFQAACHKLIQKQLSKIATPGYMGRINCTELELGTKPPFFHSMEILPKDSDFIWSFDAAVQYSGGAQIKIETRLDVNDSMSQENAVNQSLEPTLAGSGRVAADILRKGLESIEKSTDADVAQISDTAAGETRSDKAVSSNAGLQPSKGGWKSVLARVADQVSLVPITLSMRLVSLKGTVRVQIKPPPTDHIWFGFTSMPTIELQPEPSIGDHKITTGPVVAFITNRIKMLLQETLVLPNCEGVWIPWMIAETDDWIPQAEMPVPWSPLDTRDSLPREESHTIKDGSSSSGKETAQVSTSARKEAVLKQALFGSVTALSEESDPSLELERPLLENFDSVSESELRGNLGTPEASLSVGNATFRSLNDNESMDGKGNRSSRRTKVLTFGKKVTEKLDEKRRLVVDKVREGLEKYEQAGK